MSEIKIEVLDDGPFIVSNLPRLSNSKGENIKVDDKIALCRCGASENKPFCDGTHKKIEYTGKRETEKSLHAEKAYEGKDITVYDNRTICSHAAECVKNLGPVFDVEKRPWISPDNASSDEIIDVVKKCPSGALSYKENGKHIRDFKRAPEVKISKDGPYNVVGNITISLPGEMKPPTEDHYSLCRCGKSKNKPYCDGTHSDVKFRDENN